MFKGNEDLRGKGEKIEMTQEEMDEYVKCATDIFHFCRYFNIMAPDGEHPIVLRDYQIRLLKMICCNYEGKNNRIIMMGRQTGKTTLATVYLTWYALFHPSKTIAILANKQSQAEEIMLRIRNAYSKFPLWLQQGIDQQRGGWGTKKIGLENGTTMFCAASSTSSIRGKSVDLMLVDEFAHLDNNIANDFMLSVFPTQSSRPDARLLLISTPKGMNHFYEIWQKAVAGENSFVPAKIQWNEVEGRDEKWKNKVIKDMGFKHFAQEYACVCGNEVVEIYDKAHDTTIAMTIEELYEKLKE